MYQLQKLFRSLKITVRHTDRTQVLRTVGILVVAFAVLGTAPTDRKSQTVNRKSEEPEVQGVVEESANEPQQFNHLTIQPLRIPTSPPEASISAKAVFVIDNQTDTVLYEKNPDQRLPMASLTKIMTALIVLEKFQLDEIIAVPEVCAALPPSKIGLAAGQKLTVEELLYGMLVVSGSDASCALSHHFDGDFLELMNQKAADFGLSQTHFENEVGFDGEDGNHLSTASDLVKLSQAALKNGVFRKIVGTREVSVGGYSLTSTNELLFTLPGTTGIKTGETPEAKGCLAISYERGGHEIIGVLLGSDDRFPDAYTILDWIFENHQ